LWMPVRLSSTTPAPLGLSMMRRVEACVESHGGKFSTYYKCTLSAKTHKLNISGDMLICTSLLVLVCVTRAQNLSAPFNCTLYVVFPHITTCLCTLLNRTDQNCNLWDY
jgi:hypothetical protein